MKRLALLVAAAVGGMFWLGLGAAPAFADAGPHYSTTGNFAVDRCAACHRAHTAQGSYLLKQSQPALCYTCHGAGAGGATTDVQDGVGYGSNGGALRGGGFEFALINSGSASLDANRVGTVPALAVGSGKASTSSHSVDGSPAIAWGNGAVNSGVGKTIALRCGSCHDPHGNGNYRILRAIPEESGVADTNPGVVIPDAAIKIYTTTNYWSADDPNAPAGTPVTKVDHYTGLPVTYTPSKFLENSSAWCSQCHTRYLASSGSYKTPLTAADPNDPTKTITDPTYTYRHRSDINYKAPGANCITCHVAHGTDASMNGTNSSQVANPGGNGPVGSSKLLRIDNRGTCNMCHNL